MDIPEFEPNSLRNAIRNSTEFLEEDDADVDALEIKSQSSYRKRLENERYKHDTNARKWLANWSAIVVSVWLFLVIIILFENSNRLHLADSVLSVLLGTTTLNILGLSYIVLKGYFPSNEKKDQ